ncbi:unnamed protein product [Amoebophrya sp. A25]|nr:unnamed protein product [Amoebophrya sp. A25]|eukprot:GSA25T00016894001.1
MRAAKLLLLKAASCGVMAHYSAARGLAREALRKKARSLAHGRLKQKKAGASTSRKEYQRQGALSLLQLDEKAGVLQRIQQRREAYEKATDMPHLHFLILADENFQKRMSKQIKSIECYAKYWGYTAKVLNPRPQDNPYGKKCMNEHDVFFVRHCLVAEYLDHSDPNTVIMLLDADVAARGFMPNMDSYLRDFKDKKTDLIFYERGWGLHERNEVMAGAYMARNSEKAKKFLRYWGTMEHGRPKGYSSSDNGALHLALAQVLGKHPLDKAQECQERYDGLKASVWNLDPYADFLLCMRQLLEMGNTPTSRTGRSFEKAGGLMLTGVSQEVFEREKSLNIKPEAVIPEIKIQVLAQHEGLAPDFVYIDKAKRSPLGHGLKDWDYSAAVRWLQWKDLEKCELQDGAIATSEHAIADDEEKSLQGADKSKEGKPFASVPAKDAKGARLNRNRGLV